MKCVVQSDQQQTGQRTDAVYNSDRENARMWNRKQDPSPEARVRALEEQIGIGRRSDGSARASSHLLDYERDLITALNGCGS